MDKNNIEVDIQLKNNKQNERFVPEYKCDKVKPFGKFNS